MLQNVGRWLVSALLRLWEWLRLFLSSWQRTDKWHGDASGPKPVSLWPSEGPPPEGSPFDDTMMDLSGGKSPVDRRGVDHHMVDIDSSPVILAMERRALRQIFYRLDLPLVPSLAFVALSQTRDPVAAFKLFASWVGVNADAARDRTGTAHPRMVLAIELLSQLTPLRSFLTGVGERRIREALFATAGPDHLSILRDQAERVTIAAELHRTGTRIKELQDCVLGGRLRELINEVLFDPLAASKDEIEEGVQVGRRLEAALRRLATLEADVTRDLQSLHEAYRTGTLSNEHAAWCDVQAEAFELLLNTIVGADTLDLIEEQVAQGEAIRDGLAAMRAAGGAGARDARRPTLRDEIEQALAVLGLPRSPTPTWHVIMLRYRALVRIHNTDDPDNRATPEQLDENTKHMQEINGARDLLKQHQDKLADVMT